MSFLLLVATVSNEKENKQINPGVRTITRELSRGTAGRGLVTRHAALDVRYRGA